MDESLSNAVNKIFAEREDFIIIGLTGKTGAGCTTTANILEKDFEKNVFKKPEVSKHEDNESRKYEIIYNYALYHWKPFTVIEMRNIITSFILEHEFKEFKDFVEEESKLKGKLRLDYEEEFNKLSSERQRLKKMVEEHPIESLDNDKIKELIKFYFTDVANITNTLYKSLKDYRIDVEVENEYKKENLFTHIYQEFGKNIRSSGSPYEKEFKGETTLIIAERANKLIKILRRENRIFLQKTDLSDDDKRNLGVRVVIDCIRNPYEATFFKDRYSAFYLFSVNVSDDKRKKRLYKKNLLDEEIDTIDYMEKITKKDLKGKSPEDIRKEKIELDKKLFYWQNMQGCMEMADVYLTNEDDKGSDEDNFNLKSQLLRYIMLIMHPGLVTPSHIERSMQIAYNAKVNSGCISRQVGAVITDSNFYIKSIGWNSVPEGQVACNLRYLNKLIFNYYDDSTPYSNFELTNSKFREQVKKELGHFRNSKGDRPISYCFKDVYCNMKNNKNQVYTRSLHAEENAFLQISKFGGQGLEGGNLFTTASPCELCAKKAYQIGIKNIYYIDPYPGITEEHILENGIHRPKMIIFSGAIGRAYTQLYTPIIAYKDEISMLNE